MVEAHGLVFDIFLIGLVLVWMDVHRQNRESIERNLEGLWDLNTLTDEIYQKKKTNIIKRLNSSKVYKIDVTDLTLNDVDIRGAIFFDSALYGLKLINCRAFNLEIKKSRLNSAEFIDSKLKNTKILDSFLKNANFTRAKLSGADFRKSDLLRAKFIDANLESADLRECNLKSAVFNGANLRQVNIKQCKNINCEELIKASCLDYIKADDYIVEFIKERRPEIKIDLVR
ncbi:hypothetical protein C7N77_12360 [Aeromonas rivipollensis]|nr:hypothetical protein C7N77_12360 [Aeromonas rivipollensis]